MVITNLSTFVTEISHLELEDLSLELELAIPVLRVKILLTVRIRNSAKNAKYSG